MEPSRFSASRDWVEVVLAHDASLLPAWGNDLPISAALFSSVLPFLAHDALEIDEPPVHEVDSIKRLRSLFASPMVQHFVADARSATCNRNLALRTKDVGLRSGNPLTGRFLPMEAAKVPAALHAALVMIGGALARAVDHPRASLLVAWLASQCLLTIHPFRDGNGRSMRAFFAASCLRSVGPAPTAILATLLAHAGGGHRFHQAAWALRTGVSDPMIMLFTDAEAEAREYLAPLLGEASVPDDFVVGCHAWLRSKLK